MKRIIALLGLLILTGCGPQKPQLNLFVWNEYFSPELIADFEKRYNCHVAIDTFDTNEAMYAKLKLGASGYDIIMPSNYIFDIMVEQYLLRSINFENVPNIRFLKQHEIRKLGLEESFYGVPYMISYTGLGCRKDRIKDFEPSWTIFGRSDLRGRMTMLNDMREAIGAALITLGYSINTSEQKELDEAVSLLLQWKRNLAKFESEQFKNGLASSEYLVVQGYNTDILQVILDEAGVSFVYPKEGAILSIDYLAIPTSAPNPDLAEAFINYFLRPDSAALNMNYSLTANLVDVDQELLNPELRGNSILKLPPELQDKSQLIKSVGGALDQYSAAWEHILTE